MPFQLPLRPSTRSRYRGLWKRLLYFCFRIYRLAPAARRTILRRELTEEQQIALEKVWKDPCWTNTPFGEYCDGHVDNDVELESSTRCSSITSMTSTSSWGAESANSTRKTTESGFKIVTTDPYKASEASKHSVSELEGEEEFIDLGLDDWPVCEDSDDALKSLP